MRTLIFTVIYFAIAALAAPFTTTSETQNATLAIIKAQTAFPELAREFHEFCFYVNQGKWTPRSEASSVICLLDTFDRYRSTTFTPGTTELNETLARKQWFCKDPSFDSTREKLATCVGQLDNASPLVASMFAMCQATMASLCTATTLAQAQVFALETAQKAEASLTAMQADMTAEMEHRLADMTEQLEQQVVESEKRVKQHNDETIDRNFRIRTKDDQSIMGERVIVALFDLAIINLIARTEWKDITPLSCPKDGKIQAAIGIVIVTCWPAFLWLEGCIMAFVGRIWTLSSERFVPMSLEGMLVHLTAMFILRAACIAAEVWPQRREYVTNNVTNFFTTGGSETTAEPPAWAYNGRGATGRRRTSDSGVNAQVEALRRQFAQATQRRG